MNHQNYQGCLHSHLGPKSSFPALCCTDLQQWARNSAAERCILVSAAAAAAPALDSQRSALESGSRIGDGLSISGAESGREWIPGECWVTAAAEPGLMQGCLYQRKICAEPRPRLWLRARPGALPAPSALLEPLRVRCVSFLQFRAVCWVFKLIQPKVYACI